MTQPGLASTIEQLIAYEVREKSIPSISYAVVDRDGVLASGHVQRADATQSLNGHSLFRIGSLTKMFTSLCVMQLAERGLLDIDADVSNYVPDFHPENPFAGRESGKFGSHISLRKLMSHTSGLVREAEFGHYLDDSRPALDITVDSLKRSVLKEDPSAGIMHYSNAGIAVVGKAIEQVGGLAYADYVAQNIFRPLGMDETYFELSPEILSVLAPASMWTIDGDSPAPVFDLGGAPAGNVYSTAADMARFAICLLRGGFTAEGKSIVSPASLETMLTGVGRRPDGYSGRQKAYGLGFGIGTVDGWKSVGHGGAVYGYATQLAVLPHAGLAVQIFSTLDFSNQIADRLARRALQLALADRKMGKAPPPTPAYLPLSATYLETMPGHYETVDGGESVEIRVARGHLYLMGQGVPLELRFRGGNDFAIDGRIYGPEADYPFLELAFEANSGRLNWKGKDWRKSNRQQADTPETLLPHLGVYGPAFNPTYLQYADGSLKCLIEYFCSHVCEPLPDGTYRMHGLLYEGETLELSARDEHGRTGIRVGPMFLARDD